MKVPWSKLLAEYIGDETLSYRTISEKYRIALSTVKQHGTRENWPELRAKARQKMYQTMPEKAGESLAVTAMRHVKMGREFQTKALLALLRGTVKITTAREARMMLMTGIRIEREALGLDNMTFSEADWENLDLPKWRTELLGKR